MKLLTLPMTEDQTRELRTGDVVYIKGEIYTSRDMAHLRIKDLLEKNEPLPKDFEGNAIFHAGPVALKGKDGWNLNVIGPTTSIRMEPYAEMVGQMKVRLIIGKGGMGEDTLNACQKYGYVYLQAAPGCAAQLAEGIEKIDDVTWMDLGIPEALWSLKATCFGPMVVGMDTHGNSIYKTLRTSALQTIEQIYPH